MTATATSTRVPAHPQPATTGGRPVPPTMPPRGESDVAKVTQDARRPSIASLIAAKQAYAEVKAEIAGMPADQARATVANHLHCPNDTVSGIKIGPLLKSIRFIGEPKMLRILRDAGWPDIAISERKTVGELTERQRLGIARELTKGIR